MTGSSLSHRTKKSYCTRISSSLDHSSVPWDIIFCTFLPKTLYALDIKVQTFRLATAGTKINQIPYIVFQTISQFLCKYCITRHCHDT